MCCGIIRLNLRLNLAHQSLHRENMCEKGESRQFIDTDCTVNVPHCLRCGKEVHILFLWFKKNTTQLNKKIMIDMSAFSDTVKTKWYNSPSSCFILKKRKEPKYSSWARWWLIVMNVGFLLPSSISLSYPVLCLEKIFPVWWMKTGDKFLFCGRMDRGRNGVNSTCDQIDLFKCIVLFLMTTH